MSGNTEDALGTIWSALFGGPEWLKQVQVTGAGDLPAYSGDCDRLVQPMVITHSGDRDHLQHVTQRGAAGRVAAAGRCC